MKKRAKKSAIAKLVEAQARGERVAGVPGDDKAPQDAVLDARRSKDASTVTRSGIIWGE